MSIFKFKITVKFNVFHGKYFVFRLKNIERNRLKQFYGSFQNSLFSKYAYTVALTTVFSTDWNSHLRTFRLERRKQI
jgi:hypothetical protein